MCVCVFVCFANPSVKDVCVCLFSFVVDQIQISGFRGELGFVLIREAIRLLEVTPGRSVLA